MSKEQHQALRQQVAPFEAPVLRRSIRQLANTFLPFFALWGLAYASLSVSYALTLGLAVLAAGFLVRIFIIFHDCCHHSFFKNRKANAIVGTIAGIFTSFPYLQWQRSHSIHHATSGNLDKRGIGDMWVMTVLEYQAASRWEKLKYRLYRHPLVMFGIGPTAVFLVMNRFNVKSARRKERLNTHLTTTGMLALGALVIFFTGWEAFLLVQTPIFLISGTLGVWLFYVQHQFEDSYYETNARWEYVKAAVEGSSFYKLPKLLQWLTGNIGYHHVHHLSPRVPNYRLEDAHNSTPPLQHIPTITLATSLSSLRFHLWDESQKKFVTFREGRQLRSAS